MMACAVATKSEIMESCDTEGNIPIKNSSTQMAKTSDPDDLGLLLVAPTLIDAFGALTLFAMARAAAA